MTSLSAPAAKRERMFTFRSGGWVLAAAIAFTLIGVAWNLRPLWNSNRPPVRGDGRTPESYGFDLSTVLVPRVAIVSSGMIVDAIPSLDTPSTITPQQVRIMAEVEKGKYLVPGDKVIGVVIGDEARCYPLRVLNWHEIVNDTLGGIPIAVTYNPLSAGIAVFDRRINGETLTFGVSGLLYNSSLLMYDRRGTVGAIARAEESRRGSAPKDESLWSALQARAVAGPAAAAQARLTLIPPALSRYDAWLARYPETTVLAPIEREQDLYSRDIYATYFTSDTLKYPADPLPPANTLPWKTRVVVTGEAGWRRVIPLTIPEGETRPDAAVGPNSGEIVNGIYAYWFAWYATHAEDPGSIER